MKKNKIILFITLLSIFFYVPKVNAMKIFIEKESAENITLEVESSDTIEKVREKIYEKDNNFPPQNQRLIFNDMEMEDGRTLSDYNVQKEDIIHLFLVVDNKKFKVIFDANEGSFKDGDTFTIEEWENGMENSLEIPSRDGYNFLGYYTEKTAGTKLEMILAESGIDSDTTFYAHWEESHSVNPPITEDIENPQTSDNITISIISLILCLVVILSLIIIRNKNTNSN